MSDIKYVTMLIWVQFDLICIHISDIISEDKHSHYSYGTKNSNNETNSKVWRWNDRMRWVSKAERQLRKSARYPTEKQNNAFPQLCWPSKPWNSGAEKLIHEDRAVPVNWVKVSQALPIHLIFIFTILNLFTSSILRLLQFCLTFALKEWN